MHKVQLAQQGLVVHRGRRDHKGPRDLLDFRVPKARKGLVDRKERKERKGHKVRPVRKDPLALKVQ